MCRSGGANPTIPRLLLCPGLPTPFHLDLQPPLALILIGEAFSLQMSICLCNTEQFVTLDSESILLRSLFMLSALIMTVMNKIPGADKKNGS